MARLDRWLAIGLVALSPLATVSAETAQRERTDIYIRRLAGLPASSAEGQIKIVDVGHGRSTPC